MSSAKKVRAARGERGPRRGGVLRDRAGAGGPAEEARRGGQRVERGCRAAPGPDKKANETISTITIFSFFSNF